MAGLAPVAARLKAPKEAVPFARHERPFDRTRLSTDECRAAILSWPAVTERFAINSVAEVKSEAGSKIESL